MTDAAAAPQPPLTRPPGDAWRIVEVTAYLGLSSEGTVRGYLSRGQMPTADGRDRYGPWWQPATIIDWHTNRPRPGGHRKPRRRRATDTVGPAGQDEPNQDERDQS